MFFRNISVITVSVVNIITVSIMGPLQKAF